MPEHSHALGENASRAAAAVAERCRARSSRGRFAASANDPTRRTREAQLRRSSERTTRFGDKPFTALNGHWEQRPIPPPQLSCDTSVAQVPDWSCE
jgi:hypothetical protein